MQSYSRSVGRTNSAEILVLSAQSFNAVASVALVPDLPAIAHHFGQSHNVNFLAQAVLVAPAVSIIIGSPLAGMAGRWIGTRNLLILALLAYVTAGCFGFFASGFLPLIISRLLLGLASSFLAALCLAKAGEIDATRRARYLGLSSATSSITAICSLFASGWLASHFGWRAPFLLFLFPLPLLPPVISSVAATAAARRMATTGRYLSPLVSVAPIYSLALLLAMMIFAPTIEGPFVLAEKGMTNPSLIGLVLGLGGLVAALSSAGFGWVSARLDPRRQTQLILGIFGLTGAMIAFSVNASLAEIGLILAGISSGLMIPSIQTKLLKRLSAENTATAMGWFMSVLFGAQFLDLLVFKFIRTYLAASPFFIIALTCGIGLVASAIAGSLAKRRASSEKLPSGKIL